MAWDSDPLIITVAPCGAEVTRLQNPAVPYTPLEIAEQTAAAAQAGASIVHLHVREDDGRPTHRRDVFARTIAEISVRSDIICNVSTGGAVWMTMDERLDCLEAGAEMAGVEPGSLNFDGKPFVTSRTDARRVIERASKLGMSVEVECFDLGHIPDAQALFLDTEFPRVAWYNLVVGVPGGAPATPATLQAMVAEVPDGTRWTVTAVGRHQTRMLVMAMLLGAAGIRVGFEDNVYRARGCLARSNAELVTQVADIARRIGRRVATLREARELLF